MTEQENKEPAQTETSETSETADAPKPEKDEDKPDEDKPDDDKEDDDEKSEKKKQKKKDKDKDEDEDEDKPKKVKISYEDTMPRSEAVSYFEAIIGGLRSGRLEFKQADKTLVLNPPDRLSVEVKAQTKGSKASVVFEIEWNDENRPIEISNK